MLTHKFAKIINRMFIALFLRINKILKSSRMNDRFRVLICDHVFSIFTVSEQPFLYFDAYMVSNNF